MAVLLLGIVGLLRPYPTVADFGLTVASLPAVSHLLPYCSSLFAVGSAVLVCVVLWAVSWDAWLADRGGNANFYFAATLVWAATQVVLLAEIGWAHRKHQLPAGNGNAEKHKVE